MSDQVCADVVVFLTRRLGDGQFDRNRVIQAGTLGECVLMWGSFLGAVRDQAMAAGDYDVDIAAFLVEDVDWATVWAPLTRYMGQLGYKTAELNDRHFRVYPRDPLPWSEFAAMRNRLSSEGGLSRSQLEKAARDA